MELKVVEHCKSNKEKDYYAVSINEYLTEKNKQSKIPGEFEGVVLKCNTDWFIKKIWEQIGGDECNPVNKEGKKIINDRYCETKEKSKRHIEEYIEGLRSINKGYYIYLHAWRFHYEAGQNLYLIKNRRRQNKGIYHEIDIIDKCAALRKSMVFAEESIEILKTLKMDDHNKKLAEKHLLLSKIALSCDDKNEAQKLLEELKQLAESSFKEYDCSINSGIYTPKDEGIEQFSTFYRSNRKFSCIPPSASAFAETSSTDYYVVSEKSSSGCITEINEQRYKDFFWAYLEIMYNYLWWKYEFTRYDIFEATDEAFGKILNETAEVINTIKKDIKKDIRLWYVYHRLLVIRATVRCERAIGLTVQIDHDDRHSIFTQSKKEFREALVQLYKEGRIEYLSFLYHGYAKLFYWYRSMMCDSKYNLLRRERLEKLATGYLKKAIYLYKNLGDKEHKEICDIKKQKWDEIFHKN